MSDRQTIADSKKAFHRAFPYVIPPLYRRITDELLVELNLLSHVKGFAPSAIFAIGLTQVFDSFTQGYRPEQHLVQLFRSICKSNGFDPLELREISQRAMEALKESSVKDVKVWIGDNGGHNPKKLKNEIENLPTNNNHYSRLITIGFFSLIKGNIESKGKDNQLISNQVMEIGEEYGFSASRIERDISQYVSNLEKISQALELMKETVAYEQKKKNLNSIEKK